MKIKIYHFHNGSGGGVLSVIKNLLRFSNAENIENHIIHAVNKTTTPDYNIEPIEGAASQQLYYYSANNNFYHTCRQLAKLLPNDKAIIVAHDWIELGMSSNLGLQNPVLYVLHGDFDYYYDLAKRHSNIVDAYVCISPKMYRTLKELLPSRERDVFYLNFPVPPVMRKIALNDSLHLIYYVRDLNDHRKQFSTILQIAAQLSDSAKDYFFTIAGGGMTAASFFEVWPMALKNRVNYLGFQTNGEIIKILREQDIFLLPSLLEGLPVSLVEAMKGGVVPLVTEWDGAVDELVKPGITGYYFNIGAATDYASCIRMLHADRQLLKKLSENCIKTANTLFDPVVNTKAIEAKMIAISAPVRKRKIPVKQYGSRLDQSWLGNTLTYTFRNNLK